MKRKLADCEALKAEIAQLTAEVNDLGPASAPARSCDNQGSGADLGSQR